MAPPDVTSSQGRRQATAHAGDAVLQDQRRTLRKKLQQSRKALSPQQRELAAMAVAGHLLRWRGFHRSGRIASYYSVNAELSTQALNQWLLQSGKQLFMPCLPVVRGGPMQFRRMHADSHWRLNQYGIPEPAAHQRNQRISPAFLDIILVPLVGFDSAGNRMGMGAGFYDRSLAFRLNRQRWQRPVLIGLAYSCQQTQALPAAPWDVPLDAVVTEQGILRL